MSSLVQKRWLTLLDAHPARAQIILPSERNLASLSNNETKGTKDVVVAADTVEEATEESNGPEGWVLPKHRSCVVCPVSDSRALEMVLE